MDNIRRIKPIRREKSVGGNRVKVSTLLKGFIILTILGLASAAAIYGDSTIVGVSDVNSTNLIYSPTYCNATVCKELSAWDTNTGVIPADFFNNITDAQAALAGNNTVRDSNDSALAGRLDTVEGWGDWATPMGEATENITLLNGSVPKWDNALQNVVEDTTPQLGGTLDGQDTYEFIGVNAGEVNNYFNITVDDGCLNIGTGGGRICANTTEIYLEAP